MAFIALDDDKPGMRGLLHFRPAVAHPLMNLMEVLMRSNDGLSIGEREVIATYVSSLNDCFNCHSIHGEIAQCFYGDQPGLINNIKKDFRNTTLPDKFKALLEIAESVQKGGKHVREDQVEKAKKEGATDLEIHDTVLIAAVFCFYNRYVDGLGIVSKDTPETLKQRGKMMAEHGYI